MKNLLLIGGNGALGKAVVNAFKATGAWRISNIDVTHNDDVDENYLIDGNSSIGPQVRTLREEHLETYDSIICTAGGWAGGSIKDEEGLESFDIMHKVCTMSALMTGHIASHHLAPSGLLVFTGAKVAFTEPAPGMIGYHVAKTATHAIAQNMATLDDLHDDNVVLTILPETLDTPGNREAMPDADYSTWADCDQVASLLKMWANEENVPKNGSFVALEVSEGSVCTKFL
ncbi:unnamed protein product [Moneuplotes crassus]|uniref:Dihydropteridine reductase n=2 Tax=Euplotes crassus TaxID=5936 RepID=A0AAD2D4T6_EUPCR|nr:unnamed protein product [Moneuplotes crassus]